LAVEGNSQVLLDFRGNAGVLKAENTVLKAKIDKCSTFSIVLKMLSSTEKFSSFARL
jgi:hypothetical protein